MQTIEGLKVTLLEYVKRTGHKPLRLYVTEEEHKEISERAGKRPGIEMKLLFFGVPVETSREHACEIHQDEKDCEWAPCVRNDLDLRDDEREVLIHDTRCGSCPHLNILHRYDVTGSRTLKICTIKGCKCFHRVLT